MSNLIRRATLQDLTALVGLFDAYRQFYGQPSDREGATAFLRARMERAESVILVSGAGAQLTGFCQLYPSFSSVRMAPILILNDLFIDPGSRRAGLAAALLDAAVALARSGGVTRLSLETGRDNIAAKALYERMGWRADFDTTVYGLEIAANWARGYSPDV